MMLRPILPTQCLHFKGSHRSADAQRAPDRSLQISKVYSVAHWARMRFSLKYSSRGRVSYLKSCLSNSLDVASPSFELQSPANTNKRKKTTSRYPEKAHRESRIASRQSEFPFAKKTCEKGWKEKAENLTLKKKSHCFYSTRSGF